MFTTMCASGYPSDAVVLANIVIQPGTRSSYWSLMFWKLKSILSCSLLVGSCLWSKSRTYHLSAACAVLNLAMAGGTKGAGSCQLALSRRAFLLLVHFGFPLVVFLGCAQSLRWLHHCQLTLWSLLRFLVYTCEKPAEVACLWLHMPTCFGATDPAGLLPSPVLQRCL